MVRVFPCQDAVESEKILRTFRMEGRGMTFRSEFVPVVERRVTRDAEGSMRSMVSRTETLMLRYSWVSLRFIRANDGGAALHPCMITRTARIQRTACSPLMVDPLLSRGIRDLIPPGIISSLFRLMTPPLSDIVYKCVDLYAY
jgi:hypothetical protein